LAHLPPDLARRPTLKTTFSTKWPPRTYAESGQVEPVLGACFSHFHFRMLITIK
jgi:hypothetical protein